MANKPGCEARQFSDQMRCERCNVTWDVNDPDEPECKKLKVGSGTARSLLESLAPPQKQGVSLLTLPNLPLNHLPACGVQCGLFLSPYPDTAFVVVSRDERAHHETNRNYLFFDAMGQPRFEVDVSNVGYSHNVRMRYFQVYGQRSEWVRI